MTEIGWIVKLIRESDSAEFEPGGERLPSKALINCSQVPSGIDEAVRSGVLCAEFFRNGALLSIDEVIDEQREKFELEVTLPSVDYNRIYSTFEQFYDFCLPKISQGEFPNDVYLRDIDWYSGDSVEHQQITLLKEVCAAIGALAELAHYCDDSSGGSHRSLVFLRTEDSVGTKAIPVPLNIPLGDFQKLSEGEIDLKDLTECLNEGSARHGLEKRLIFVQSLIDLVKDIPEEQRFSALLSRWAELLRLYRDNLDLYVNKFSFHKHRKEMSEFELDFSSRYSELLSSLNARVLSVPVSFALVAIMLRFNDIWIHLVLNCALVIAGIVVYRGIDSHGDQLKAIKHSQGIVLGAIEDNADNLTPEAKKTVNSHLSKIKNNIIAQQKKLESNISLFKFLAWLPAVSGLIVLLLSDGKMIIALEWLSVTVGDLSIPGLLGPE